MEGVEFGGAALLDVNSKSFIQIQPLKLSNSALRKKQKKEEVKILAQCS